MLLEEKIMDTAKTEEVNDKMNTLEDNVNAKISTIVEQTAKGIMALLGHQISLHDGKLDALQVSLSDLVKKYDIQDKVHRSFADRCDRMCLRLHDLEQGMEICFDQLDPPMMAKSDTGEPTLDEARFHEDTTVQPSSIPDFHGCMFDMPMTREEIDHAWNVYLSETASYVKESTMG